MNIHIIRIRRKTETIDGHLYINGSTKICDTAENALHALPAGTYPIEIIKCKFHSRKMPVIRLHGEDVITNRCSMCEKPDCVTINSTPHKGGAGGGLLFCPMLTAGNGVYKRTDGAILLGEYLVPGCLKHPKAAFERVYQMIRKASERGHEITLTISESYPKVL